MDEGLERARIAVTATNKNQARDMVNRIESALVYSNPKLAIKSGNTYTMVDKADIDYVEVDQGLLTLFSQNQSYYMKQSLTSLKSKLPAHFLYVSKYAIVNIHAISRLEVAFSGNYYAFLRFGQKITVSRRFVKELKSSLGI